MTSPRRPSMHAKAETSGFTRPGEDDRAWFESLVPGHPDVSTRPMFGNLAAFARDQMFLCLFGPTVAVRLGPEDRAELRMHEGASEFEPMPGRPMTEYVALPARWRADREQAQAWVNRSLRYALSLPPKKRR